MMSGIPSPVTSAIQSAQALSSSKRFQAKGDELAASWWPIIGFGAQYNLDSDALNDYSRYFNKFTPNNVAFGFSILVPVFDIGRRSKAKESAADLLRASVEAEQAQRQNDVQIATISGNLRELDALAEIASLKQQIAAEQLKAVQSQLEFGNGAGAGPGSPPQLTPKAEQLAHISERKEFIDALDASSDLSKARLSLLRALGHMDDWLRTLSPAPPQNK